MPGSFNTNFPFHAKTTDMEKRPSRIKRPSRASMSGGRFTNNNAKGPSVPLSGNTRINDGTDNGNKGFPPGQPQMLTEYNPDNPAGFNLMQNSDNRNSLSSTGKTPATRRRRGTGAVTGGVAFAPPMTRLEIALKHMRGKLAKLYDISDDIEVAITDIMDEEEDPGVDL